MSSQSKPYEADDIQRMGSYEVNAQMLNLLTSILYELQEITQLVRQL